MDGPRRPGAQSSGNRAEPEIRFPAQLFPCAGERRRGEARGQRICSRLPENQFVFRSDVKSYYASIDHAVLLALVRDRIDDRSVLNLVGQYLYRTVDENCLYTTVTMGISLGCRLSPVMAAIYLEGLDRRMEATGLTYARFMDDWVILAPTRWALRRAVVIVNETLRELRVEQHPDKTSSDGSSGDLRFSAIGLRRRA